MDTTSIIVAVVSLVGVLAVGIVAPVWLLSRTEKMHREDRREDWARQDLVAARAEQTSKDIADRAAQAARLLLADNERVAAVQKETNGKLDVIHELVNSTLSAAMQDKLDALVTAAAMMREVIDLKRAAGREPAPEALAALADVEDSIRESRAAIADRNRQAEAIADRRAAAAAAAADDPEAKP